MADGPRQPRYDMCGAKTRSGGTCARPAGWGTPNKVGVCKLHGGMMPNHLRHAEKLNAQAAVVTYGLPREVDPHQALMEELHRTAGHVTWLAMVVQQLEQNQLHGPVGGGQGGIPEHKPHVWVQMYAAERKHLTAVAKTCIDVGIEERRIRVAERAGEQMAQLIRGVLGELGVPLEDPRTREVVVRHLRLIEGTATEVAA